MSENFTAVKIWHFLQTWKEITSDLSILNMVKGIKIPFTETPLQTSPFPQPYKVFREEELLIISKLNAMIRKQIIEEIAWPENVFISNVFGQNKKDGSL